MVANIILFWAGICVGVLHPDGERMSISLVAGVVTLFLVDVTLGSLMANVQKWRSLVWAFLPVAVAGAYSAQAPLNEESIFRVMLASAAISFAIATRSRLQSTAISRTNRE